MRDAGTIHIAEPRSISLHVAPLTLARPGSRENGELKGPGPHAIGTAQPSGEGSHIIDGKRSVVLNPGYFRWARQKLIQVTPPPGGVEALPGTASRRPVQDYL